MGKSLPELISTEELAAALTDPNLRILDGSYYLPGQDRNPRAECASLHIHGAQFFDIDSICDSSSPLPHMLPSEEVFAEAVAALGIGNDHDVVVYDRMGQPTGYAHCYIPLIQC